MRNLPKPLIMVAAILIVLIALVALILVLNTSTSNTLKTGASTSPSASVSPVPVTRPSASPAPTSGAVTYIHIDQWSSMRSNPSDATAPMIVSITLTVVPGVDLTSSSLEISLLPADSSAAISPAPASSAAVSPFDPSVRQAQSLVVSFLVPVSVSSGTLVVSSSGGSELYRQQLAWIISK